MTPQDQPAPAPPRLARSSADEKVAGVCAGLARQLGVDANLVRLVFVVLTFVGGGGIALYLILWILLPADDGPSVLQQPGSTGRKALLALLLVGAVIWLPFAGPGLFFIGPALLVFAVLGAIGLLLWRAVGGEGDASLTRIALLVLAVAGALLLGAGAGIAAAFGGGVWVSGVVVAAGLALVVAGFLGGARWLIIPALVMAAPLAFVAATDIDLTGGVGERDYRPASVADLNDSYRLGVGELAVDLSDVDLPSGSSDLRLDVGMGHIRLTVPPDACVRLRGHVGAGRIDAFDRSNEGLDVTVDRGPGASGGASILAVDARAGVGHIEIDRSGFGADQLACTT